MANQAKRKKEKKIVDGVKWERYVGDTFWITEPKS